VILWLRLASRLRRIRAVRQQPGRPAVRSAFAAAILLATAACTTTPRPASIPQIGLFTTLPILWPEAADLRSQLNTRTSPHWALSVLRKNGALVPQDSLAPITRTSLLIMAQPRPLSPRENVELDNWVRRGGRLLLFADPMLTAESAFALGDKRRPQDVVLLSPILARWGLELTYDDERAAGEYRVAWPGGAIPVNLPGQFRLAKGSGQCSLVADGLGAQCRIGRGRVLAIADAAVLEDRPEVERGQRPAMLDALIAQALTAD
jgi:hypothetical protein